MTRRESSIEQSFRRWCVRNGHRCVKLQSPERGFPDRTVFAADGRLVFLEFKRPGGRVSPHQKRWIDFLRSRGFAAAVVWSVEEAVGLIGRG